MASDNETVADVVKEMRRDCFDKQGQTFFGVNDIRKRCDRVMAAWRREKAQIEADALATGALVEAARKPMRNCDRFDNEYDASHAWRKECCLYAENDYGGVWLVMEGCPDFNKWLFAPCEEGGQVK